MSVTYGAGGSTRDRTRDIVVQVNDTQPFPAMPHLTCSGHTREQITALLDEYAAAGIHNILALAGDPPADGSDPGGEFTYATELVELVRDHPGDFAIGVAAHPELHPRSEGDREADRRWLAAKLAPGRLRHHAVLLRGRRLPPHGRRAGRARVARRRCCRASCRRARRRCPA